MAFPILGLRALVQRERRFECKNQARLTRDIKLFALRTSRGNRADAAADQCSYTCSLSTACQRANSRAQSTQPNASFHRTGIPKH